MPASARCGSVTVPLDRGNPSTGTIDIAYALLPRTDTSRPALGTIVPNPGGPGSGAIDQAADFGELLAPLRRRRDILLIDPRGTGRSGALSCPGLAAKDPLSLDLAGIVTTCGADLGARIGLYGSAVVADARVVTDAVADGTQQIRGHTTRTRLRLRGHGVSPSQLTLLTAGTTTRITGVVAGRRVTLQVTSAP